MAERYLVRGEMSGWFIFGRVVGPLAMAGRVITMLAEPIVPPASSLRWAWY